MEEDSAAKKMAFATTICFGICWFNALFCAYYYKFIQEENRELVEDGITTDHTALEMYVAR